MSLTSLVRHDLKHRNVEEAALSEALLDEKAYLRAGSCIYFVSLSPDCGTARQLGLSFHHFIDESLS